jgi:high-affinity nickel-transport protein
MSTNQTELPTGRIVTLISLLIVANAAAWALAWLCWHGSPLLLAGAVIAYGYGLRHAVDADHISAIDNTTRKLMQDGKRPIGVGFFFSLGHSTIVVALCACLAVGTAYVAKHLPEWKAIGNDVGTGISCAFLFIIGLANLVIFVDLMRRARTLEGDDPQVQALLDQRGIMNRIFRPVMRLVNQSWHMYLVGFLFGLGFDTATEVGILSLSARSGQAEIPFWTMMLLPLLFTVGMCLVDTLDGILMLRAYGWATVDASRKLSYNLGITLISVLVAFAVGIRELLPLIGVEISIHGSLWAWLDTNLGLVIVGVFLVGWAIAGLVFRLRATATA